MRRKSEYDRDAPVGENDEKKDLSFKMHRVERSGTIENGKPEFDGVKKDGIR